MTSTRTCARMPKQNTIHSQRVRARTLRARGAVPSSARFDILPLRIRGVARSTPSCNDSRGALVSSSRVGAELVGDASPGRSVAGFASASSRASPEWDEGASSGTVGNSSKSSPLMRRILSRGRLTVFPKRMPARGGVDVKKFVTVSLVLSAKLFVPFTLRPRTIAAQVRRALVKTAGQRSFSLSR